MRNKYTKQSRPKIGPRTLNPVEIEICQFLEGQGYTVVKRGWPDFLACRSNEVRFIEVKSGPNGRLKPSQKMVADILSKLGITIEILQPDNKHLWAGDKGGGGE